MRKCKASHFFFFFNCFGCRGNGFGERCQDNAMGERILSVLTRAVTFFLQNDEAGFLPHATHQRYLKMDHRPIMD